MSDSVSLSTTPTLSSDFDFRDATCVFSMSRTDSFSHAGEDELELDSSKQNITSESTERVFTHKLRVFEENGNETICKRVSFSSENATEKLENFTVGSYDFVDTSSGRDLVLEKEENLEHGERNGQELPAPEEDPSVRSVKYLEKHHILRLFQVRSFCYE